MKNFNFLFAATFALFTQSALAGVLNSASLKNCKNIAIVAGTYDPFTNGHEIMGKQILKNLEFDCVVYLPTGNPPHKIASPLKSRYDMMEAALKNEEKLFYPDWEDLNKLSPKDYVTKLKTYGGETRKVFAVLGSDLSPQNRMYWINRYRLDPDGYIITGRGTEEVDVAKAFNNRPHHVLPIEESYSSTQARKWFAANEKVYFKGGDIGTSYPTNVIKKDVAQYIADHGMYLASDGVTTRSPLRILKTGFTQGLNKVGLFHPLRSLLVKKNAQGTLTEVVIDVPRMVNGVKTTEKVTLPLTKHLGSGLTADAYIFKYQGEDMVVKIANARPNSPFSIKQDMLIGEWLNKNTRILVPPIIASAENGGYKVTQLIRGESLGDYMKRTGGIIEPHIEAQLKNTVDDMLKLSARTNIKLDLSVDNLKIWNGKVYLIDAGPIPADVTHPMSYDAFLSKWKSHSGTSGSMLSKVKSTLAIPFKTPEPPKLKVLELEGGKLKHVGFNLNKGGQPVSVWYKDAQTAFGQWKSENPANVEVRQFIKDLESGKASTAVRASLGSSELKTLPIVQSASGQMSVTLNGAKFDIEKLDKLSVQDVQVLKKYSSFNTPKVFSEDLASGFRLTSHSSGETLSEFMSRNGGKLTPKVETQLKKLIDDAHLLSGETKIRLDLAPENIRIWNENVSLVKVRHADVGVKLPKDYSSYLASVKTAPKSNFKCGKIMSSLLQLKTY